MRKFVKINNNNIKNTIKRHYSSELKNELSHLIPEKRERLNKIKFLLNDKVIDNVSANQLIGGMRGIKCMLWDNSSLDSEKGITFHNKTIDELRKDLPSFKNNEPMAESMLWFLLTGNIPTKKQSLSLSKDLHEKSIIPLDIKEKINNLPNNMHPMTKLSVSILLLQPNSQFVKNYNEGMIKNDYWEPIYDDIIEIIAKLPEICALIYKNTYNKKHTIDYNNEIDYVGNFCRMLGFNNIEFEELMRLYFLIHSDHEGGNASAHTCRLVGSTLSDPYLSLASSMNALAGPLHGLANQEVLNWIMELKNDFDNNNKELIKENISEYCWNQLNNGKVIPGYGHAVLRNTDPRFLCQREFALKHLPNNELFKLVDILFKILPDILHQHGKTKNPYPNVDAHSGVLLHHYNLKEQEFYTVLFGISRTIGVLSQLFWDRALLLPLERPKSLTVDQLTLMCK